MKTQLRALLGTRHRLAAEGIEEVGPAGSPNPPSTEDTTIVMKGPLADQYSAELAKVYDKDAPPPSTAPVDPAEATPPAGEGGDPAATDGAAATPPAPPASGDPAAQPEPAAETGAVVDADNLTPKVPETLDPVEAETGANIEKVVLESQAIDAAVAASIATAISDMPPSDGGSYQTLYAIDETQVKPDTVVDVTKVLAEAENPENVTVLIDDVVPDSVGDAMPEAEVAQQKELILGLEHMVVGMGGKVVRNFGDFVKLQAQRKKA